MFVRAFVEIRVPPDAAGKILRRLPQTLLEDVAIEATNRSNVLLADVGLPVAGLRLDKRVQIDLGPPMETPSRTCLPLSWKAAGGATFFPLLDGELEAASLGKGLTQIGFSSRYKPPFGLVGSTVDRILLHRVAEATISDFLQRIAQAIEDGYRVDRIAEGVAS